MKPFTHLICTALIIGLFSCQKDTEAPDLVISASEVAAGEIVTAEVVHPRPGTSYEWLLPNRTIDFDGIQDTSKIRVLYARAGLDSIMVTLSQNGIPYAFLAKAVRIKEEHFTAPAELAQNTVQPITGNKLFLQSLLMPDSTLAFVVKTTGRYDCLNSYIVARNTAFDKTIKASFNEVWKTGACEAGNLTAIGMLFTNSHYPDGSWPIEITFGNKTYRGTIKVSDYYKKFEFIWPDSSEVYISPYSLGYF